METLTVYSLSSLGKAENSDVLMNPNLTLGRILPFTSPNEYLWPGMVVDACSASIQKAMVWASHVQGQPELDSKILSQKQQQKKNCTLINSRALQIQKKHKETRLMC